MGDGWAQLTKRGGMIVQLRMSVKLRAAGVEFPHQFKPLYTELSSTNASVVSYYVSCFVLLQLEVLCTPGASVTKQRSKKINVYALLNDFFL